MTLQDKTETINDLDRTLNNSVYQEKTLDEPNIASSDYSYWRNNEPLDAQISLKNVISDSIWWLSTWNTNIVFTATNSNTVSWNKWTINLPNNVNYTINAWDTWDMKNITYIYLYTNISTTELQTTTVSETAVWKNKLLICVASPVIYTNKKAEFQAFWTRWSNKLITWDTIAGNTIAGNSIVDNDLTSRQINTTSINLSEFAWDLWNIADWWWYAKTTPDEKNWAWYAYTWLDSSWRLITAMKPAVTYAPPSSWAWLLIDTNKMWYYKGWKWETYIGNDWHFHFSWDANNYIDWNWTVLDFSWKIVAGADSSISWKYVDWTNKPEDNATAWATWWTNLYNIPDSATQSYITKTGITATTIESPTIKWNDGLFSGSIKVWTSTDYITIDWPNKLIKSKAYTAWSKGWQIKYDGSAEFNNITVRWTVDSSTIQSSTITWTTITWWTIQTATTKKRIVISWNNNDIKVYNDATWSNNKNVLSIWYNIWNNNTNLIWGNIANDDSKDWPLIYMSSNRKSNTARFIWTNSDNNFFTVSIEAYDKSKSWLWVKWIAGFYSDSIYIWNSLDNNWALISKISLNWDWTITANWNVSFTKKLTVSWTTTLQWSKLYLTYSNTYFENDNWNLSWVWWKIYTDWNIEAWTNLIAAWSCSVAADDWIYFWDDNLYVSWWKLKFYDWSDTYTISMTKD